jgi:futalosine hydrolase
MLLIIAAAPLETSLLRKQIANVQISLCGATQVFSGKLAEKDILLSHGGIGQVNMAMQLTRLLDSDTPTAVLLCGCAGYYPASGLKIGDLALATDEYFADLGVATTEQFVPLEKLDLPQQSHLAPVVKQSLPLDQTLFNRARKILPEITCGTFATVNCCSGSPELSFELERRSDAICESMEGAAAAQVCENRGVPLLELRGMSNPTGTRDPQQWDVVAGATAAQRAILKLLKHWSTD